MKKGILTISLDFELYWGLIDQLQIEDYESNLKNVHKVIPKLLNLFSKNSINATWATVGFLFLKNKEEILINYPSELPNYSKTILSPYTYLNKQKKLSSKYHFAPELIDLIKNTRGQEIATHTFSHYYCLEEGQDTQSFESDLKKALEIAKNNGCLIKSIVFPRNQFSDSHLNILFKNNIQSYRGNQLHWAYNQGADKNQTYITRIFRLIDSYINLSGYNTYHSSFLRKKNRPMNLPASFFIRPYSRKLLLLNNLKLKRIKNSMTHAAKNKEMIHLWWHPHNFGKNITKNFLFLNEIIDHYQFLNKKYGMESMNMGEIASIN